MAVTTPDDAFVALVKAVDDWASHHMDQWEKFKYQTEYGMIYVTISMQDPYPDSFDHVDQVTGRWKPTSHCCSKARTSSRTDTEPALKD